METTPLTPECPIIPAILLFPGELTKHFSGIISGAD
jgi:hypothetical protein